MLNHFRFAVFALALAAVPLVATAGELTVKIADGRATVIAKDVTVRQILAEWARVGDTRVVNAEKVPGGPVTLELVDVPEKDALDILLRTAAGYMAAPRPVNVVGASQFDRVIILATSRAPITTVTAPPQPFNRAATMPQLPPQPPPEDDDDGEPSDQGPMPPPGMQNPVLQNPGIQPFPGPTPVSPGFNPMNPGVNPAMQQPGAQPQPVSAPRPGQLPPPQTVPGNPYVPQMPAGARPGQPTRPGAPIDQDQDPDDR